MLSISSEHKYVGPKSYLGLWNNFISKALREWSMLIVASLLLARSEVNILTNCHFIIEPDDKPPLFAQAMACFTPPLRPTTAFLIGNVGIDKDSDTIGRQNLPLAKTRGKSDRKTFH